MTTAFQKIQRRHRIDSAKPVHEYRLDAPGAPVAESFTLHGPATGYRLTRAGSHDFSCFSNLVRTIIRPGMSDLEKALAVYRFSNRFLHHAQMGFGGTEMTRFINCYGYSFCWGQACFQHLIYEAAGLQARAPLLTGHSSVEVFIDGQWRAIDAYMRLLIPSLDLTGIATGASLRANAERFDHARCGPVIAPAKNYWSGHAPGAGTYEPWQDSRAMSLSLRRGESFRVGPENWGQWCMSPTEPPHYLNGLWSWRPTLDQVFLSREADHAENVALRDGRLEAIDPAKPAILEVSIKSPYPLTNGVIRPRWSADADCSLAISFDGGRRWQHLASGDSDSLEASLDGKLTLRGRPPNDDIRAHECFGFVLRLTWTNAPLEGLDIACHLQLHAPAWPSAQRGVNQFTSIGADAGAAIEHAWEEYPGFTASDLLPFQGDAVVLTARVHNRSDKPAVDVPVEFRVRGSGQVIGNATIARIEPRASADASITWIATPDAGRARYGRPYNDETTSLYVHTQLEARVATNTPIAEGFSDTARLALRVRPRPIPRLNDELLWAGAATEHGGRADAPPDASGELVFRACVVHLSDTAHEYAYQYDTPLDVEVAIFDGPPERGLPLAAPRRLIGIQPSEFAVAEWRLPTSTLPDSLDVYVEARTSAPVLPEHRRLVAHKLVRVR